MSPFKLYFPLGFNHIADLAAYDHILFLVALCGMFTVKNWRHLLGLISAFSLGHTLTLALCAFQVIRPNVQVVELLIPVTILFTAFSNVVDYSNRRLVLDKVGYKYVLTGLFGLIHGMGFSNYFAFLITGETHIGRPLFYFTLGIEVGQVVIVGVILLLAHLMRTLFFFKGTEWNLFLSGIAAGISFLMVIEKSAFLFAAPLTVSTEVQAPVCPDQPNGSIQVTAQGGFPEYRYYWSTGQQTPSLSGLAPGTYSVTVEDEQSQLAVWSHGQGDGRQTRIPLPVVRRANGQTSPQPLAGHLWSYRDRSERLYRSFGSGHWPIKLLSIIPFSLIFLPFK